MSAVLQEPAIRLRPMQDVDIDTVMEIELAAYDFPWTVGIFRDCLRVGYCSWVVTQDDDIVGYGVMSIGANESHILNVCMRKQVQRRGLATHMIKHLLNLAQRHAADICFLEVRPSNHAAVDLYYKLGFNEAGLRKGYYPSYNGHEDAIILALALTGYEDEK